jgi:hypothetical protein
MLSTPGVPATTDPEMVRVAAEFRKYLPAKIFALKVNIFGKSRGRVS